MTQNPAPDEPPVLRGIAVPDAAEGPADPVPAGSAPTAASAPHNPTPGDDIPVGDAARTSTTSTGDGSGAAGDHEVVDPAMGRKTQEDESPRGAAEADSDGHVGSVPSSGIGPGPGGD